METMPESAMKAAVRTEYGLPHDVLAVDDVARPVAAADQVLVRVQASSVNPADWHSLVGTPYLVRLGGGLRRPKRTTLGLDLAGRVEAVGAGVTRFRPGDDVYGEAWGAFAGYVTATERSLATKPSTMTYEQAAAVPVAALTALQGLRDRGGIEAGHHVLINGASGGVGTFAVQIAKALGAEVTAVCSTRNVEMVRSLGADGIVDYTREDVAAAGGRFDLILDNVGNWPLSACRRLLVPGGTYVMVGGPKGRWLGPLPRMAHGLLRFRFSGEKFAWFVAKANQRDLVTLAELIDAGSLRSVIDRTYALDRVAAALDYLSEGHAQGKTVITVGGAGDIDDSEV